MCEFFNKRGYRAPVVQAGQHRAQQIDRQSALQTSQKDNNTPFADHLCEKDIHFREV